MANASRDHSISQTGPVPAIMSSPSPSDQTSALRTPTICPACNVCRLRKTKCDRALPQCGRCIRLGESCSYDGHQQAAQHASTALLTKGQLAKAQVHFVPIQPAPPAMRSDKPSTTNPAALSSPPSTNKVHDPIDHFPMHHDENITSPLSSFPSFSAVPRLDPFEMMQTLPEQDVFAMELDWIPDCQFLTYPVPPTSADVANAQHVPALDSNPHSLTAFELQVLHNAYSNDIHHALPFLDLERFRRELAADPHSVSILALSYGMALLGSTVLPEYHHLISICYASARRCIDQCEGDESGSHIGSLNLLQAMVLVMRYEITDRQLQRAYFTTGRAIRLMKVLGLHTIDRGSQPDFLEIWDLGMRLPPSEDARVLEERRRTFWILYILESYITTRTSIPGELGDSKTFNVRLPSPGSLDSSLQMTLMPFLGQTAGALNDPRIVTKSSFAGCVLMVELALECFSHSRRRYLSGFGGADGFWDNHYRLVKSFNSRAITLKQYIKADAVRNDPISLSVQLNLCAAEIFFHETAILEAARQGLPEHVGSESQQLGIAAALRIAQTIEVTSPTQQPRNGIFNVQATFLAWPLAMALKALCPVLPPLQTSNVASEVAAHSMRLLKSALDAAESIDGHWHTLVAPVESILQHWDQYERDNQLAQATQSTSLHQGTIA